MGWFKTVGVITGFQTMMDEVATQLVANGWTREIINAQSAAVVPGVGEIGREDLYRAPGLAPGAGDPADFFIRFFRSRDIVFGFHRFSFHGFHGKKPSVALTPVSVTTVGGVLATANVLAHGLSTGHRVVYNGGSQPGLHQLQDSPTAPTTHLITVLDANNFTFNLVNATTLVGLGGKLYSTFNEFGSDDNGLTNMTSFGTDLTDVAMDMYGFVNERAAAFLIVQGAVHHVCLIGEVGRDRNTQAQERSRSKLAAPVVGDGATPQILTLDRASPNHYVGQKINLLPVDSALPQSISIRESALEEFAITQIDSPTQIRGIVSANTYPTGTLVGLDPEPALVAGISGNVGIPPSVDLNTILCRFAHQVNGSRTNRSGQNYMCTPLGVAQEAEMDPDARGRRTVDDLFFLATTAKGVRGPAIGIYACSEDPGWTDQDLFRTGDPALAPADDYMAFKNQPVGVDYRTAVGPGAS